VAADVQRELVLVLEHGVAHGTHVLDVVLFTLGAALAATRLCDYLNGALS